MLYPLSYEGMWDILLTYARISKSAGVCVARSAAALAPPIPRAINARGANACAPAAVRSATYDQPCALPSFYHTQPDAQGRNR